MKCLETCYQIYKEATHTRITPEDLFHLITGKTQELLRSDLQLMINGFLERFHTLRADSSVLGRGLSKHSSYHEPQSGSPVWLRHSKNRSMLDFESYKNLVHPRTKEEGLTLSQFQRIEFPSGELPDLYYVLVYVLYGEQTLEYARTTLRIPFYKIHLDTSQEGPIQHSKVIPERIELRIQKQEIKVVKVKKSPEKIKQAIKLIKRTYPQYSLGSQITKEIYYCMIRVVVQIMDYSYFPIGIVISKASFLENSDAIFGRYAPTMANSMFYELGNLADNPSIEQIAFPRIVDYFYLHFFKKNMFPETKNMEAFRYIDLNKDGRLTSNDFEGLEESGEIKLSPGFDLEFSRLKDTFLSILWGPKGFRDPHIDLLTFNRVTDKDSALIQLIQTQLEVLWREGLQDQKQEQEEGSNSDENSLMFEAIKIEFQEGAQL